MSPAKIRSVAWPRIRGPTAIRTTLTTVSTTTTRRLDPLRAHPAEQPLGRRPKFDGLLAHHAAAERAAAGAGTRRTRSVSFSRPAAARAVRRLVPRGAGAVAAASSGRSCRLLRAQLGGDDLLVGRRSARAARHGCRGRPPARPRARGSGRRRGSWRPAGRRSPPSRRRVTGASAARSRASVARSSAENESSKR